MRTDEELKKMLVEKVQHYQDTLPVFRVRNLNAQELHSEALKMILPFLETEQLRELRFDSSRNENFTRLNLQENASLLYYHASGYKLFRKNTPPFSKMVSDDAEKADVSAFKGMACDLLEKSRLNVAASNEKLKFERLWQLKAAGMTQEGEKTPAVINRLVYAYRRYVNEVPVWGSASVFIKTAAEYELEEFGIDWRKIQEEP